MESKSTIITKGYAGEREIPDELAKARASGRYMVAVWHISGDGKLQHFFKTSDFPIGDFNVATMRLKRWCDTESDKNKEEEVE